MAREEAHERRLFTLAKSHTPCLFTLTKGRGSSPAEVAKGRAEEPHDVLGDQDLDPVLLGRGLQSGAHVHVRREVRRVDFYLRPW